MAPGNGPPSGGSEYGLWWLVALNVAVFAGFAASFFKPKTRTDWRTLGAFSAFLLALFTEMYGFPLTLYLMWSWLGSRLPGLDPLSHEAGHLWPVLLGLPGDPHLLQWPTLVTLVLFPWLVLMYVRLARREEGQMRQRFGEAYERYAAETPAFVPRVSRTGARRAGGGG